MFLILSDINRHFPLAISLEGPKLYQPQDEQAARIKYETSCGDPLLNNTIELLRYVGAPSTPPPRLSSLITVRANPPMAP